jgi:hypothetical protein
MKKADGFGSTPALLSPQEREQLKAMTEDGLEQTGVLGMEPENQGDLNTLMNGFAHVGTKIVEGAPSLDHAKEAVGVVIEILEQEVWSNSNLIESLTKFLIQAINSRFQSQMRGHFQAAEQHLFDSLVADSRHRQAAMRGAVGGYANAAIERFRAQGMTDEQLAQLAQFAQGLN